MGNDGGSIPTRRELVKEAARNPTTDELKETRQEQQEFFWNTDPTSNKPLVPPIVSDCVGKLYNKDSILEFLIPSDDTRRKVEIERVLQGNVKSLRDIVEVKFAVDANTSGSEDKGQQRSRNQVERTEKWICPITNKTLGPGSASKAVYLVPCGHAFSASVVKEVAEEKCLQCGEPYAPNDIIPIIPVEEADIARLSLRMNLLREKGLTHALKKAPGSGKKRKKNAEGEGNKENGATLAEKQRAQAASTNISNASTASLTARVLKEQEERNKKRKTEKNGVLESLFTSQDQGKMKGKNTDFMTRGFDIPANAKR